MYPYVCVHIIILNIFLVVEFPFGSIITVDIFLLKNTISKCIVSVFSFTPKSLVIMGV